MVLGPGDEFVIIGNSSLEVPVPQAWQTKVVKRRLLGPLRTVIFYKDMDDWVQELKGRRAVALQIIDRVRLGLALHQPVSFGSGHGSSRRNDTAAL